MKKSWSVLLAGAIAIAGCAGEAGDRGPAGEQGQQGEPGVSTGSISGTVKVSYDNGATTVPVQGATVSVLPAQDVSATTDAAGAFTLVNVPVGIYSVVVSGAGITGDEVKNVVVVARGTATANVTAKYSPVSVAVAAPSAKNGAIGYDQAVELTATPAGGTAPYTYKWELVRAGAFVPTEVQLANATTEKVSFTTGKFGDMVPRLPQIDDDYFRIPERMGVLPFSPELIKYMTYTLQVTVTDAKGFRQVAKATVPVGTTQGGGKFLARNLRVVLNAPEATTYAWTVTGPSGDVALDDATIRNPSFVPTAVGTYIAKNGAAELKFTVGDYAANCKTCHAGDLGFGYKAIAAKWENSAHGNHWFKKFERDASGALVPKAGAVFETAIGDPVALWTNWASPKPMTTFEFGMSNGEGAHYGENCVGCHTVGFNKNADNGGLDEVAGYVFRSDLMHDGGDITKPDTGAWDALSAAAKGFAGMQCESCHGPLTGDHPANLTAAAYANYDAKACAVCHDSVGHHDRNMLFAQSGHANLELAIEEGTSTNCGRCHSAQGFVAWSKVGFDPATNLAAAPTAEEVQPVTCAACHDAHSTGLRVDESAPIKTTSGFTVAGAGAGQLCVVCHSNRRGAHNDAVAGTLSSSAWYQLPHGSAQSDVFFGQNAFFVDLTDTVSVHAYVIEGTCAGCHMEPEHASETLYKAPATTNHTFKPKANICADCHEGSARAALTESVEAKLHVLETALAAEAKSMLAANATFKIGTDRFSTQPDVVSMGAEGQHGMAVTLKWNAPVTVVRDGVATPVVLGDAATGYTLGVAVNGVKTTAATPANVFTEGSDFLKAYWNYGLVEEDQTFGAHNPGFVQKVLSATIAKLQ